MLMKHGKLIPRAEKARPLLPEERKEDLPKEEIIIAPAALKDEDVERIATRVIAKLLEVLPTGAPEKPTLGSEASILPLDEAIIDLIDTEGLDLSGDTERAKGITAEIESDSSAIEKLRRLKQEQPNG